MMKTKVNVFALPNQTTILFGLIVIVVLGAVSVGAIFTSLHLIWPFAVVLLLLPARAFLATPEREFARHDLKPAGDDLATLQTEIKSCATKIGLCRTPQVVVTSKNFPGEIGTFGTFRHWYIAIDSNVALALQNDLVNPATAPTSEALLIHELYHFKTGDYLQMGYAGALLSFAAKFMAWAALFFLGFVIMLALALPELAQLNVDELIEKINVPVPLKESDIWARMNKELHIPLEGIRSESHKFNFNRAGTFFISTTLPFAIMGFILWWIYWPKLWRTREFYADAGAVKTQKESRPLVSALSNIPLTILRMSPKTLSTEALGQTPRQKKHLWEQIKKGVGFLTKRKFHNKIRRIKAFNDPSEVFDTWVGTAVLVGTLVLVLEMLLSTPFTLFVYASQGGIHFPVLAVLVVISLNSLIPNIVLGRPILKDTLKIMGVVIGLKLTLTLLTVIPLITTLSQMTPEEFSEWLENIAAVMVGVTVNTEPPDLADPHVFVAKTTAVASAQVFFIVVVWLVGLAGVSFLLQRLFRWYSFPRAERCLIRRAYGGIGVVSLFIACNLLPFITGVVLPEVVNFILALTDTPPLSPEELTESFPLILVAFGSIITAVGVGLFIHADRKYANRCPSCGETVSGAYELGKRCAACNEQLHPWLIAEYDT